MSFLIKTVISALVIAVVSEIAKRSTYFAAIIASLPLVSILAIIWIYLDSKNAQQVIAFSYGVFWAILPSILFFIILPFLLKLNLNFYCALAISCLAMAGGYAIYVAILKKFGVQF